MLIKIEMEGKVFAMKIKDSAVTSFYIVAVLIMLIYAVAMVLAAAVSGTDAVELLRYFAE